MERDVRGDARVAVAIGADPGAEPEQRRGGGRAGPGRARVGGQARVERGGHGAGGRNGARAGRVERAVDGPLEPGHHREQRLVEDRERGPHLVQRRRGHGAQVARVPQERDLLAQAAAQVGVLVGRRERVVQRVEQPPDPPQGDQQRAAPRLGRMGGEHRVDDEAAGPSPRRGRGRGPGRAARRPRRSTRRSARPRARRARVAQDADPLPLLGEVDELEVQRERLGDGGRTRQVQARDLRRPAAPARRPAGTGSPGRRGGARSSGAGSAPRARTAPARLLRDDLPEQRAEQPDLARAAGRGRARCRGPQARRRPPGTGIGTGGWDDDRRSRAQGSPTGRAPSPVPGLRFDCKGTVPVPRRNRLR